MNTLHLDSSNQGPAVEMARACFPGYTGRKYRVSVRDSGSMDLTSYWDGGSRSYYAVYRLADSAVLPIPENGSMYAPGLPENLPLPCPGFAVVEHSIFCGQDTGITVHLHPDNAAKFLPPSTELSWADKVVLAATRSLKSSYGGRTRFDEAHSETKITRAEWDDAKESLIGRGLLNKAGAITPAGKNAIGRTDLWALRQERAA